MKTQKSKRWQDGAQRCYLFWICVFQSNINTGTASFDEQSSVFSVSSEEGKVLGSKVVARPEIGSEFEFEDFLVTVEEHRTALEDVTNRAIQQPSLSCNPSKNHKHLQPLPSQQDARISADCAHESQCDTKFLVAYTRCESRVFVLDLDHEYPSHFCRQKTQKNKRWLDGMATYDAISGKLTVFSEDHHHLGSTIVHPVPCVGSEMDFCGMLVTINDELHERISQAPDTQTRPQPCNQVTSHPTVRPSPVERAFVEIGAPLDNPIHRTDDEVLELLMPRSMKLARVGANCSQSFSGGSNSRSIVDGCIMTSDSASRPLNLSPASAQQFAPSAPPKFSACFAASFRQLPGSKSSHLDIDAPTNKRPSSDNVPKSSALQSTTISDDFDDSSSKYLHHSFKQQRGIAPPTCIANSFEAFHETMKSGVLQLPLDLDPGELSKLYEKRHMRIPDSFASLSEYASTFRSALWEGEAFYGFGALQAFSDDVILD